MPIAPGQQFPPKDGGTDELITQLDPASRKVAGWPRTLLLCSAIHSGVWGVFIMAMPELAARTYGFARPPRDIHLWQGSGLFITLLAIGYLLACRDPIRHYGVVLIGLLAKTFGALGVTWAVSQGQVSKNVLWLIPINDVIWWLPFALIVRNGIRAESAADDAIQT